MGRGKRALAAAAILAVLVAASLAAAPRAAAEGGELRGDLPVAGGFALASWSGGTAGALAETARSRGCNVDAVYANAPGGGLVGYFPATRVAAANREFLAAYPEGLPASPVYVACGEPVLPRIVFLGDESFLSAERRVELREHVASVVRFYAERFGAVVPESTLYVSPDGDIAAAVYRELTGDEYPVFTGEGGAVTDTPDAGILAFVSGSLVERTNSFVRVLAHEHYHMIQRDILRAGGGSYASPEWLIEGTAEYGTDLYIETRPYPLQIWASDTERAWALRLVEATFEDVALQFGFQNYEIAAAAIGWLVEASGNPRADLEYWRALASGQTDWRGAFSSAFGLTVSEFFDAIDEYRAELDKSLPRIRGKVVDLEGRPLRGARVAAKAGREWVHRITDDNGSFELPVTNGHWNLLLGRVPGASPGQLYVSVFWGSFWHDSESGFANSCKPSLIEVDGEDIGSIVISILPALLTMNEEPICNEGRPGFRMISGTVIDLDGTNLAYNELMTGYHYGLNTVLAVYLERESGLNWEHVKRIQDDDVRDQAFIFYVGEGQYRLRLNHVRDFGVLGEGWYADSGITANPDLATVFEVADADITGIEVRLPAKFPSSQ